jgi:hypothetical protein
MKKQNQIAEKQFRVQENKSWLGWLVNKKVKEFYESITLYHTNTHTQNSVIDHANELTEETYENDNSTKDLTELVNTGDTKVIKFNGF